MHRTRVITSIIGVTTLLIVIGLGNLPVFGLVIAAASIIGLQEFYAFVEAQKLPVFTLPGLFIGGVFSLHCLVVTVFEKNDLTGFTFTLVLISLFLYALADTGTLAQRLPALAAMFFGIMYVCWLFGHLIFLRGLPHGKQFIFYLLLVVWSGDTGAYYAGKAFGRHKLSPLISPGKTLEGALGGTIASVLASCIAKVTFFSKLSIVDCVLLGLSMSIIAQLGDLCESLLKRSANVKDSGTIVPGHGGILDRMDGVMFAAPLLYYYAIVFVI
ncbi:phosphatidate cytidylyltransferase [candidate division KSB3 bacterium]|uniref:Phosphatidate cytidylyltransferase n=1 Tax=candidate division KSB3 bacterium TaxID=2044937 RepID=A0A2G6E2M5_9BACT|nr:MAG: phosphatidate cytidylyltransferase [candidate division KSB3 bacterium]PIE28589.1 MAG: phosphatidate cytidylyltransferase [candidate division KSB3 bacterium]